MIVIGVMWIYWRRSRGRRGWSMRRNGPSNTSLLNGRCKRIVRHIIVASRRFKVIDQCTGTGRNVWQLIVLITGYTWATSAHVYELDRTRGAPWQRVNERFKSERVWFLVFASCRRSRGCNVRRIVAREFLVMVHG
jgi:hypothetical protein